MEAQFGNPWLDKFCEILQIASPNVTSLDLHVPNDGACKVTVHFIADEDVLQLAGKRMAEKDGTVVIGHLSAGDPKQKEGP